LLFGYTKTETAVENFDKIKEAINDTSFLLNINYEHMFDVVDNKITNETVSKLKEEIYILINEIKMSIRKFDSTENLQFVRDSVVIYINQLESKLKELSRIKYKINLVEFDDYEGVYRLIQRKNGIADLEDSYIAPSVVNFNYGEIYTGKVRSNDKKKIHKLQIIGDNEDKNQEENMRTAIQPTYNDDGTITWLNPEYQNIWNKLSILYKKILMSDKEWLLKTMSMYVKYKKENKPIEFVVPDNLIIPPRILENGMYDFGNDIYNQKFNKQDKSYQKILLTTYTEKNGVKDYSTLIDILNNLIKQDIGFNKYI